ncbi:Aquaporin-1 [Recurvomyces mirabilis]|uniref:Aquaporin-1 n=1 Tax=Recurvomyces mirabilis TaxID=574656 RepID=A0AAE0TNK4_9PEZI|nr:Aquaporin-1 [Recurvomyces mirabilis]KAK5154297.1 Aquaporin-1 [Recurvomyces mirabilis]
MNVNAPSDRLINLPFIRTHVELPGIEHNPEKGRKELRLPGIGFMPNKFRNHFIAMMGEFVGTFLFLFFAFAATQVANTAAAAQDVGNQGAGNASGAGGLSQAPNASTLLYISLAFGFSLAVNAWVFFRITGGLFNPAVTLALALIGAVNWGRAGLVFIAQILGSMAASGVVLCLYPGAMNVSTTLGGNTSIAQGLFIEMFLTAMLVFTILMLAAEKHKGTFLAPVGIGLALFVCELAGVYFTGGSLNPARSFGPCVALRVFTHYHWIYWLGPILGSLLAVGFYRFIKVLEYETANPGQDFNEKEAEAFEFDEDTAATGADVSRPVAAPIAESPQSQSQPSQTALNDASLLSPPQTSVTTSSDEPEISPLSKSRSMPPDVQRNRPTSSSSQTASGLPVPGNIIKPSTTTGAVNGDKHDSAFRNGPAAEAGGVQGGTYRVPGQKTADATQTAKQAIVGSGAGPQLERSALSPVPAVKGTAVSPQGVGGKDAILDDQDSRDE